MIKKRNIAQEIIEGLAEIKAGGGKHYIVEPPTGLKLIRTKTGLSQSEFAACLNISHRTLQEWEQGRSKPTGAAVSLLNIVNDYPDIFFKKPSHRE